MTVKLHQPVAGLQAEEEYSGPMESWLLALGYASDPNDSTDKVNVTGVADVADDPTLAENREDPGTPFAIAGEEHEPDKTQLEPNPLDGLRNRTIGGEEDPEVQAQTEARDGSVAAEDVADGKPEVQELAELAAEDAAGTGDVTHDEPAPATPVEAPVAEGTSDESDAA
jgi:hypothetical protein